MSCSPPFTGYIEFKRLEKTSANNQQFKMDPKDTTLEKGSRTYAFARYKRVVQKKNCYGYEF